MGRGWRLGGWGCADPWDLGCLRGGPLQDLSAPDVEVGRVGALPLGNEQSCPPAQSLSIQDSAPRCFRVPVHLVHGSQQPAYTLYAWKTGSTAWPSSHPRHPSVSAGRPDLCCYLVRGCSVGRGGLGVCPFRSGSTASPPPLAHVSLHADVRKPALGHFSPVV